MGAMLRLVAHDERRPLHLIGCHDSDARMSEICCLDGYLAHVLQVEHKLQTYPVLRIRTKRKNEFYVCLISLAR